jgi:hypothetical protein
MLLAGVYINNPHIVPDGIPHRLEMKRGHGCQDLIQAEVRKGGYMVQNPGGSGFKTFLASSSQVASYHLRWVKGSFWV